MTTRITTAAAIVFVVVVIALWVRHRSALDRRNALLAEAVATARAKDERRIAALREAATKPTPADARACPHKSRARVVRLSSIDERGGSLHDVIAAAAEQRDPSPWSHELDVVDRRAFLYDYDAGAVVCVGTDAEDPHGTLVAF